MSFSSGPYAVTISVTDQVTYHLKQSAKHLRAQCDPARITAQDAFPQYKALFDQLRATFGVGFFNLNYDAAFLTGWPGAFTDFGNGGRFDRRQSLNAPNGALPNQLAVVRLVIVQWKREDLQ